MMVHSAQRIQVIDSLRGMAVLGILLMNIPFFALPEHTAMNLEIRQEYSGWNYYTWWIVEMFFHGSMRGLFSMLFVFVWSDPWIFAAVAWRHFVRLCHLRYVSVPLSANACQVAASDGRSTFDLTHCKNHIDRECPLTAEEGGFSHSFKRHQSACTN